MDTETAKRLRFLALTFLCVCSTFGQEGQGGALSALLPKLPGWTLSEAPRFFSPGTLFEYIDGAAENYLSYGFQQLLVGDFKKDESAASLTVEIYDMGEETRAFGVYSSERYPDSRFLDIGAQGYLEEGTLNFFMDKYYVKLLCFDCGQSGDSVLRSAAGQVEGKVGVKAKLPPLLSVFPREGLVANSEKFILQNVLGYAFLHHGYIADYRVADQEFELFIIQGTSPRDAKEMLDRYLEIHRQAGQPVRTVAQDYQVKDRYSQNIFLALSGDMILGVMRVKDGYEELGKKYLLRLVRSVTE